MKKQEILEFLKDWAIKSFQIFASIAAVLFTIFLFCYIVTAFSTGHILLGTGLVAGVCVLIGFMETCSKS